MNADLLRLYLVLDPVLCRDARGMVDTAVAAVRGGATVVQLRAPDWKKRAFAECGRALMAALEPYRTPLIINDHVDVAVAIGAAGVHVGQKDLSPADSRRLMPPGMILGLSVSSMDECEAVDPALVDYLGIGPVWATLTKTDAAPAVGLDGLRAIAAAAPCPSVAIGSVKAENAAAVMACGVDGIAVVSAICGQSDPSAAARRLAALTER